MWATVTLFSLVIIAAIIYIIKSIKTKRYQNDIIKREGCEPPLCLPNKWFPPLGLDKLGKVIEAEKSYTYPLLMLNEHEKHGDTYGQYSGPLYTLITRDPRNLRALLARQFENFEIGPGRHGCVSPLLGDGIFTQDGRKWEFSRKMLAHLIQKPTLPDLKLIERHFQKLLNNIKTATKQSENCVNLKNILFDLSLGLTTEFLLGQSALSSDKENNFGTSIWTDNLTKELNTAFKWIAKRERLKNFYWMVDSKEFRASCKAARQLVDDIIEGMSQAVKADDVSKESYGALKSLFEEQVDGSIIRDQFLNLLLAGRDTSGSLLCWAFYSLAREPDLVKLLKAETASAMGPRSYEAPNKSELNKMAKLDQFITETLRVFPPVPINCRFSIETTSLPHGGGTDGEAPILVPKGTLIAFSTFATHHSPKLYGDDASIFRIDRWHDDITKERRLIDWSYQPFIGGPRKCLGERFALTQAKYLTCRILQMFDEVTATDELGNALQTPSYGSWVADVKYHVGLTMSPQAGVWVRLTPAV